MMDTWIGSDARGRDDTPGSRWRLAIPVSVFMLMALFGSASTATALRQEGEGFAISACDDSAPTTESPFAAQLPPGVALSVLADEATDAWPPFARGLVMTVRHLTLDPDVTAATRQSQGPVLFYVESGTLAVSVNGQPQTVQQGAALLIQRSENYQLRNEDASASATVLRVQVVPPGGETKVARGDIAMAVDDEQALSPGPPFIQSRLLLTTDVPAADGLTHLVLGCLSWPDVSADTGEAAHAGPVALLVLNGQMLVGESGSLAAGQCAVFNGNVAHRLRAGSPAPTVLLIGILPDGMPFWAEPAGTEQPPSRLAFSCDPDAAPDAVPDAAWRPSADDRARAPA